jgi:hypothetical protein
VSVTGQHAVRLLDTLRGRVELFRKDNTDKLWSYKLKSPKRTEFAFDPKTRTGLFVRVDREIPSMPGIDAIESIAGKDVSTALDRVFSGGIHKAKYKATIVDEDALLRLIAHYESL